jgi:glycosyltransferase involved in cell wall biosynthesis
MSAGSQPRNSSGATVPVSVVMPVYNAEKYVGEAVKSILAQTFRDFEFLIVDDGSTDSSLAILQEYAARDSRIRLVSRPNTGYLVALNEMLERAEGEWIARMDADDIALPERFERQLRYLADHPDCVMVGSRAIIIDPDGHTLTTMVDAFSHEDIDSTLMKGESCVFHPAVMFRKQAALELGGYRKEYEFAEDMDLWLRFAEIGRIANLDEPLLKYREHFKKIGHVQATRQSDLTRRLLEEAHHRRGLTPPESVRSFNRPAVGHGDRFRTWGWWALMSGNVSTARKHAMSCLLRLPMARSSWKLAYCALRGR